MEISFEEREKFERVVANADSLQEIHTAINDCYGTDIPPHIAVKNRQLYKEILSNHVPYTNSIAFKSEYTFTSISGMIKTMLSVYDYYAYEVDVKLLAL